MVTINYHIHILISLLPCNNHFDISASGIGLT